MPIAAVPAYLEQDFRNASPGMRFGMYLAIWTSRTDQEQEINFLAKKKSSQAQEIRQIRDQQGMDAAIAHARQRKSFPRLWEKNDFGSKNAWKDISRLTESDQAAIQGLLARQAHCAATSGDEAVWVTVARSTAPFTTGLGNEHPLENGFSFLWPYGIPYLPGSGVKGVLRQAARELAAGVWGDAAGWDDETLWPVDPDKTTLSVGLIDLLFGLESRDGEREHFRGVLNFWDVIPEIQGNRLMVEIMTPHQKHYYQDGQPPHDSGQPGPVSFLTVPPGSQFTFYVQCDLSRLRRIARDLAENDHWKGLLQAAFEHAFSWLGFGAKTTVGYGAMRIDEKAEKERREAEKAARAKAERHARIEQATAGLPEDAAQLKAWSLEDSWNTANDAFLNRMEQFLNERERVSPEARTLLVEEMNKRWKGIMDDPDATKGKKKKPKYNPRPRELAKRILGL